MTNLEITLIAIIWIGYGVFAVYQSKDLEDSVVVPLFGVYIIFSPIVFIIKALYGVFKQYK